MAFIRRPAAVVTSYYRPKPGGLCPRMFRALRALLGAGHTVHYLSVERFPIEHPRCHFHRFPWPPRHTDTPLFWAVFLCMAPLLLFWLSLRHRANVLLSFDPAYAMAMQPARLLPRRRLLLFLRADTVVNQRIKGRPGWLVRLWEMLEGLAVWRAEVVGVCAPVLDAVLARHRLLAPAHSSVLHNDLPVPSWDSGVMAGETLRLACVGTLEARKNQALVLEALAGAGTGAWRLDVYGDGPARAGLERLAADRGLGGRVRFHGWVQREAIWQNTDVLLLPSLHEGMSNAMLEALAGGVAVLASDVPEHRDVLPAASLLPPLVPQAWAARLRSLVADRRLLEALRTEQAAAARRLRFDWDAAVVRLVAGTDTERPVAHAGTL
ncbi:MAG: glycosyltransferase family 4 protein [Nevskia sp.]|nr:glycosyltransferase family 4 protein [Nevskia sp.]